MGEKIKKYLVFIRESTPSNPVAERLVEEFKEFQYVDTVSGEFDGIAKLETEKIEEISKNLAPYGINKKDIIEIEYEVFLGRSDKKNRYWISLPVVKRRSFFKNLRGFFKENKGYADELYFAGRKLYIRGSVDQISKLGEFERILCDQLKEYINEKRIKTYFCFDSFSFKPVKTASATSS